MLFWLFGGLLFAILVSIFLYPIYPNEKKMENEKNVIYSKYQGILGACCPYEVTEKKYWLLEKKIMDLSFHEDIDFHKASIISINGNSELKIKYNQYEFGPDGVIETDTIIKIEKE